MANELAIIESQNAIAKFVTIFSKSQKVSSERALGMYEVAKFDFKKQLLEKGIGSDCTEISVGGVFLDVTRSGMSFSSIENHVYLMTRSVRKPNSDGYEKRLYFSPTPDGKIFLCKKAGSIKEIENVELVYDCDEFAVYRKEDGMKTVTHKQKIPRAAGAKIIAAYVFMTLPSNKLECFVMVKEDWERLATYSNKQNRDKGANPLYTSMPDKTIDPGFLKAKVISFALKNKSKAKIVSQNMVEEPEEIVDDIEHEELDDITAEDLKEVEKENNKPTLAPAQPELANVTEPELVQSEDLNPAEPF